MVFESNKKVRLDISGVSFADLLAVARHGAKVELTAGAIAAMEKSRKYIDGYAAGGVPVYGVSTGFGALANRDIDIKDRTQLQKSLIRSHAAGVGEPLPDEVVRAMLLILTASLCRGHSGVRADVHVDEARLGAQAA